MNAFFHLLPSVRERLKPAIDRWGLGVTELNADTVYLDNQYCRLTLNNVDNRYVGFRIGNPLDSEQNEFLLTGYLDTIEDGLSNRLLPLPDSDWGDSERCDFYLDSYCRILMDYLEAPISGNFAWVDEYIRLDQERNYLCDKIIDEFSNGNPKAMEVYDKMRNGVSGWKDDARKLKSP